MAGKPVNEVDDHVGRRLRARRKEIGLPMTNLADALRISYQQIQKYENGSNRVTASRLWDLANALDVDVAYFFEGVEKAVPARRHRSSGKR